VPFEDSSSAEPDILFNESSTSDLHGASPKTWSKILHHVDHQPAELYIRILGEFPKNRPPRNAASESTRAIRLSTSQERSMRRDRPLGVACSLQELLLGFRETQARAFLRPARKQLLLADFAVLVVNHLSAERLGIRKRNDGIYDGRSARQEGRPVLRHLCHRTFRWLQRRISVTWRQSLAWRFTEEDGNRSLKTYRMDNEGPKPTSITPLRPPATPPPSRVS